MQIPPLGLSAITLHSLCAFFFAVAWIGLLFAAITGYGAVLLRVLRVPVTGLLAVLAGLPMVTFLGGLLNAFSLVTRPTLFAFTGIGIIAALLLLRFNHGPASAPATRSMMATTLRFITLAVFAFRIAASVHDCHLQISDDFNYYLAAPVKMLETHSFRGDVFSERRVMSSIGANEFLDTLVIAALPVECVQMADWTLGIVLTAMLAFAIGREFNLSDEQGGVLALLFAITPQLRFNLTFVLLPSAVFIALVYVAARQDKAGRWPVVQAVLLGGLAGAVSSMKSSYVVHAVLFLCAIATVRWWKHGAPKAMRFLSIASSAGIFVMLPWMVANLHTAGTMFYPLLGKGFQYSAYGHYPPPTNPALGIFLHKVLPFCVPLILLLAAELIWGEREERPLAVTALTAAALIGAMVNGIATGGDSVRRYNYPCILPAITLAYVLFARRRNLAPTIVKWRWLEGLAGAFALLVAINTGTTTFTSEYKGTWEGLKASLTDYHAVTAATRARYVALQKAIPADSTTLTSVPDPFLFNFSRSTLLIADWPGAASPRPGWPLWENADALASFLLAHHIRYLAYGYNDCGPGITDCHAMLDQQQDQRRNDPTVTQWLREEAAVGYDGRHQYEALGQSRQRIFDDGKIFVLDLTQPAR